MPPSPPPSSPFEDQPTLDCIAPPEFPADVAKFYEYRKELGRGGMGIVYKVRDLETQEIIALKVLRPEISGDAAAVERFKSELRLARQITHPNVCRIHDFRRVGSAALITMEFIEGESLRDYSLRKGKLPYGEACAIMLSLCEGLEAAHRRNIVHRDLKPENVMLLASNAASSTNIGATDAFAVKLMDFGLAYMPAEDTRITGTVRGTPLYMAPEQVQALAVDPRADLYAAGLILYELLAGRPAFHADTSAGVLMRQIHESPAPLDDDADQIPPALQDVIFKCLEKDPAMRYANVAELREALWPFAEETLASGAALEIPTGGSAANNSPRIPSGRARQSGSGSLRKRSSAVSGRPGNLHAAPTESAAYAANAEKAATGDYKASSRTSLTWRFAGLAGFMAITALIVFFATRNGTGNNLPNSLAGAQTLAVLGCDERPAGDDQSLCEGLVDTLSSRLANVRGFAVVPSREAHFRKVHDVKAAREDLGASMVLNTSWQRSGDKARINLVLVDAASAATLRSSTVTASVTDLFGLQDEVVAGAERLLEVAPSEAAPRATSSKAYDYYWRGRGLLNDYDKLENLNSAVAMFKESINQDAKFAPAYAGLGEAYYLHGDVSRQKQSFDDSLAACEKAVSLDSSLSEAHTCLGLTLTANGQYERAVAEFQTALLKSPNNDTALRGLGSAYESLHRFTDAEKSFRQAIAGRPSYWAGYNWLGVYYLDQSCYVQASDVFNKMVKLAPESYRGYANMGIALNHLGRYDESRKALEKSLAIRPWDSAFNTLGVANYMLRRYSAAEENFQQAVRLGPQRYQAWGNLARAQAKLPPRASDARNSFSQGIKIAEEELKTNPRNPVLLARLGRFYTETGERARGEELLKRAVELSQNDPAVLLTTAFAKAGNADASGAMEFIERALNAGQAVNEVRDSPEFDILRGNPRFQEMLKQAAARAATSVCKN